jgi:hypothetical protein
MFPPAYQLFGRCQARARAPIYAWQTPGQVRRGGDRASCTKTTPREAKTAQRARWRKIVTQAHEALPRLAADLS